MSFPYQLAHVASAVSLNLLSSLEWAIPHMQSFGGPHHLQLILLSDMPTPMSNKSKHVMNKDPL